MRRRIISGAVVALALAGCGKPAPERTPEQGPAASAPDVRIAQAGGTVTAATVTGAGTVAMQSETSAPGQHAGGKASGHVLRVPLPARDAARLTLGADARIRFGAFNDDVIVGRVIAIAAGGGPASTVAVEIALPEDKRLRPGQTGEAMIVAKGAGTTELAVPPSAVFGRSAGDASVYVVDLATSRIHARHVSVGETGADGVRVNGGLQPGEWVALSRVDQLREGIKIAPLGPGR